MRNQNYVGPIMNTDLTSFNDWPGFHGTNGTARGRESSHEGRKRHLLRLFYSKDLTKLAILQDYKKHQILFMIGKITNFVRSFD